MSWNGDTRTKTWRFYEVSNSGGRSLLGEAKREGFETSLQLGDIEVKSVQAEALDAEGTVLVDTLAVEPEVLVHEYKGKPNLIMKQKEDGLLGWLRFKGQKIFKDGELQGGFK